ncbi:hypothetical protein O181_088934 [Austropuccinia psidii MF-1]|uniref:Uncharacterized protein n=1 Tax=Austropuccinia psidii MF-1 TaxID=1389203 RepID=A0A9Q3ISP0_9BASI|nr:hypothetical protein [Austropuccinia psidii MF-1]
MVSFQAVEGLISSLIIPGQAWQWKNLVKEEEWWKGLAECFSGSSLPSESELVGELAILLNLFTQPWILILEMRTSEPEQIVLPPVGMGLPTFVHLAKSLFLDPVTNAKFQYHNQTRKPPNLKLEHPEVPSRLGA